MGRAQLPAADSSALVAGKPTSAMDYQAGIEALPRFRRRALGDRPTNPRRRRNDLV